MGRRSSDSEDRQPQPPQKEAQTTLVFLLFLLQLIGEQSDQPQQTLEQTKPLTRPRQEAQASLQQQLLKRLQPQEEKPQH
ncbi:hypothetical protein AMELA_G00218420 [Ameiurus melas]|uniref:Uncharacterized protein n=1 Tax=Ameiurus melas TaxID=219545 RepID=A0A7J6A441_AMEME|nr:hypothetical protein AMELA_G00218420 [Ameiurus melas]